MTFLNKRSNLHTWHESIAAKPSPSYSLLVVFYSQQDVAGNDPLFPHVGGTISCELEELCHEVLQDSGQVDWMILSRDLDGGRRWCTRRGPSNPFAFMLDFEKPSNSSNGEQQTGFEGC